MICDRFTNEATDIRQGVLMATGESYLDTNGQNAGHRW